MHNIFVLNSSMLWCHKLAIYEKIVNDLLYFSSGWRGWAWSHDQFMIKSCKDNSNCPYSSLKYFCEIRDLKIWTFTSSFASLLCILWLRLFSSSMIMSCNSVIWSEHLAACMARFLRKIAFPVFLLMRICKFLSSLGSFWRINYNYRLLKLCIGCIWITAICVISK